MKLDDLRFELSNPNVRAFLKAIRLGEGTSGEDGYCIIVGGGRFTDMSRHPQPRVWVERYKLWSSAAGAYQIIFPTWRGLVSQYGFQDFSPESQDMAAVALIHGRMALADVRTGHLAEAVHKCRAEWASLPGSPYGQRTESMHAVESVYLENGGVLA